TLCPGIGGTLYRGIPGTLSPGMGGTLSPEYSIMHRPLQQRHNLRRANRLRRRSRRKQGIIHPDRPQLLTQRRNILLPQPNHLILLPHRLRQNLLKITPLLQRLPLLPSLRHLQRPILLNIHPRKPLQPHSHQSINLRLRIPYGRALPALMSRPAIPGIRLSPIHTITAHTASSLIL
ncbi:MAG: hypothetical protein HKK67_09090, partial [Chlorobiaceae bacterium]|nr:hypothetical protein [Chlorobiaceae bacterium]